jgi:hypothetical protein
VPYARSVEVLGLSFDALVMSFQDILLPGTSSAAARAIDKILRASVSIKSHISQILQAVRKLLTQPVNIVDKVKVLEGYAFLVARSFPEEIYLHLSFIMEALQVVDACDSVMALEVLKIVFAVGKTLYTMSPAESNDAHEMAHQIRETVAKFARRFGEDFEVIEVLILPARIDSRSSQTCFSFRC